MVYPYLLMTPLEILYLALAGGFLILVFIIALVLFQLFRTLKAAQMVIEDLRDTTFDLRRLKDFSLLTILGIIRTIFRLRG